MSRRLNRWVPVALLILCLTSLPALSHATTMSGAGFWETPIEHIVDFLVGPVAMAMVMLGFIGVFLGQAAPNGIYNPVNRALLVMTLCGSILIAARPYIKSLFAS